MVKKHERRRPLKRERKIEGQVFDEQTLTTLRKLMKLGIIDKVGGPIAIGKEANVFLAFLKDEPRIVKIFRIETTSFQNILPYIEGDRRFKISHRKHVLVFEWAKKEFRNLERAYQAGAKVPRPFKVMRNVLVMGFIGIDSTPAVPLNTVPFNQIKNPQKLCNKLLAELRLLYKKAGLVHSDFSEFNVLMKNIDEPYLIDFAQAILTNQLNAKKFIERDAENFVRYFNKLGLKLEKGKVLREITEEKI